MTIPLGGWVLPWSYERIWGWVGLVGKFLSLNLYAKMDHPLQTILHYPVFTKQYSKCSVVYAFGMGVPDILGLAKDSQNRPKVLKQLNDDRPAILSKWQVNVLRIQLFMNFPTETNLNFQDQVLWPFWGRGAKTHMVGYVNWSSTQTCGGMSQNKNCSSGVDSSPEET